MLAKLKISQRLAIAIAVPLLLLVCLTGYDLALSWKERSEMSKLAPLAEGVAKVSRFIHEMQRERGASAVFLGSKGAQMRAELPGLRKRTDDERQSATAAMNALADSATGEFRQAITKAGSAVGALDARRKNIDAQSISSAESTTYFTDTIAALLAVTYEIAKVSGQGDVSLAVSAYVNFIQGKERAGQERAVGAGGIAAGRFDLAGYRRVIGLALTQNVFFDNFLAAAKPEQREFYRQTVAGTVNDAVMKMRDIVADGGLSGELKGLDGKAWFDATTAKIDLLKTVDDRIAADLTHLTQAKYAEATSALLVLGAMSAFGVGLTLVLVFIMTRSITGPVNTLSKVMRTLAGGDTSVTVEGVARRDEIGEMAAAVQVFKDNMIETERLRAEQVEAEKRAIDEKRATMHKLADDFQSSVGGIIGTVSTAATELESAAGTLTKTAETTQQLATVVAAASEEASSNVNSVASATEELGSSVNEISRQVQESSRIAAEAVTQAERTDARITELSQAANRIGDVVKLITAIAEQTNLLALNATIEAARAGEAGRGFAVVAQEVKALAAQTAKATDEIGTQISGMQAATQDSVNAIKEIGGTIGRISEIASAIAVAVEEQGAATQEISRNVAQAAQGTAQVAANITDVNQGAGETGTASGQVLSSAQQLAGESNRLKTEVDKFLATVRAA